jgi:branched-chain amino acid transport system ATP-binding protein
MLELRNVFAGYAETTVLRDVDLVVPDGAVVALLGPNGAGKTTLLRVASGLLRPSAGALVLDGQDVTGWSSDRLARAGICHVPEGRGIFPSLTVRENLDVQAGSRKADSAVARAIDAFPILGERLTQRAGTLSGGQQQMLALARAYIAEPKVALLDEVSMGLAPNIVDEIFEFIGRLAASGTSLLLVEQYVDAALARADYVFLLNRGRVSFAGEPAELADTNLFEQYLGVQADAN